MGSFVGWDIRLGPGSVCGYHSRIPMTVEFLKWGGVWDGLLALCLELTPGVFRDYTECQGVVSCVQGKSLNFCSISLAQKSCFLLRKPCSA